MTTAKRFIGTKTILAEAMTRGDYNAYRGWVTPTGEDQSVHGYLVEYTDGGTPNDTRHAGYISWSPKEQFDNAYRERPLAPGLAPHQQRVIDERNDLRDRLGKLQAFFGTGKFSFLDVDEQSRLQRQVFPMNAYLEILNERIGAFTA